MKTKKEKKEKGYKPMRCEEVVDACFEWAFLSIFNCFKQGVVPVKTEEFFYDHMMRVSPTNVPKYIQK